MVNYIPLNAVTVKEEFPVEYIQDILESLSQSLWFSAIDLKMGFYQCVMEEESKKYTAFVTASGQYEQNRMAFGLRNAPAFFTRLMKSVLGHLPFVKVYLDDIIVNSQTFDQHIEHIKEVLACLKKANLKVNINKCQFLMREIKVLGHIIKNGQIKMDPEKVEAITKYASPSNKKELQRFLGLTGYYRQFIESYSKILKPLHSLLKNDVAYVWDEVKEKAVETLKKKITSYPVLRTPDRSREFIISCDASGYALGATLGQLDDNGKEYVIAYASRLLKAAELNYGITRKECLAVVWAIKKFHVYIYGTRFTVVTDHSALTWLFTAKDLVNACSRWNAFISLYDFNIVHRKGKIHYNADALSRPAIKTILQ